MPISDIASLRASPLFKRLPMLAKMSANQLGRFVSIFNAIVARAMRGGADEAEAEARAVPIALTGAKMALAPPAGRKAEQAEVVFAAMADTMLHSGSIDGEVDIDLVFPDAGDLTLAFAGNAFNNNHDARDPVGIIRRFASRDELPEDLKAKVDPDIKVVAFGSYFEDVPEEERLATISPEWVTFGKLAIPHAWAITGDPANDPVLGIKQVAAAEALEKDSLAANIDKERRTLQAQGQSMPDETANEELTAKYAALEQRLAAAETSAKEVDGLKSRLAALAGVDNADPAEVNAADLAKTVETRFASLEAELKKAGTELATIREESAKDAAERFASDLFDKKEIAVEAKAKWAAIHVKDPAEAETLAETLPDRVLKPGVQKSAGVVPTLDEKEAAVLQARIDAAMGLRKEGA